MSWDLMGYPINHPGIKVGYPTAAGWDLVGIHLAPSNAMPAGVLPTPVKSLRAVPEMEC